MRRFYAGVAVVTCATLLLEILLTRIFSYTLYYHFAFLVISVALFGLGAAGVSLYVRSEAYPREKLEEQLALHARKFALWTLVALAYVLYHGVSGRMDVFHKPRFTSQTFFELALLYGVAAVPLYHSGMVVSLAITHLRERIGTLYFFDLAGAALGCALAGPLLLLLGAENAVLLTAVMSAGAAVIFLPRSPAGRPAWGRIALAAGILLGLLFNLWTGVLRVGSFKEVDEQYVTFSRWNSFSRIVVEERPDKRPSLYIDAMARTELYGSADVDAPEPPGDAYNGVSGLVYAVRQRGHALILGPGGGIDVVAALRAGHRVTAVEINPLIAEDVMQGAFLEKTGGLYRRPDVRVVIDEGRSFVSRTDRHFDVIQATMVDTWAATASGAFALTENYLYTVEAFQDYLEHLGRDGVLAVTRWCIPPDMECIRAVTVAREALRRMGIPSGDRHMYFAWKQPVGTLLVRRAPFPDWEVRQLDDAVKARGLQVLFAPGQEREDTLARLVRGADPQPVIDAFPADISPSTDDRPFFFYGVKPGDLLSALGNPEWLMINSYSVAVLVALFFIVTLLVLVFFLAPLAVHKREALRGRTLSKLRDLSFFGCIGVGFIVVEVALLQRFSLFLGHPSYSLVVVLFAILAASAAGSLVSERFPERHRRTVLAGAALAVAALTVLYVYLLPPLFAAALGASLAARIALTVALVAVPGFVMGMMLPSGVRLVSTRHPEIVPWGWGINGAASVFGSVGSMLVAMNLGARVAMLVGAAFYLLALLAGFRRPGHPAPHAAPAPAPAAPATEAPPRASPGPGGSTPPPAAPASAEADA